jgi:hypothetical protein
VSRLSELTARQSELLSRSAVERDAMLYDLQDIGGTVARVDRILLVMQRSLLNPVMIAAGVGLLVVLGRSRSLRLLGLVPAALRVAVPLLRRRRSVPRDRG